MHLWAFKRGAVGTPLSKGDFSLPCRGSLGQTHPGPPELAQLTLTGACFEGGSTEVKVVSCLEPREMLQSQHIPALLKQQTKAGSETGP